MEMEDGTDQGRVVGLEITLWVKLTREQVLMRESRWLAKNARSMLHASGYR